MPGLDDTGFSIKNLDEIKTDLEQDFKDALGPAINLQSTSLLGALVGIFSNNLSDVWELSESVYLSRYIDTTSGDSLDRLVALLGITRKQDFKTSGIVYISGRTGTIIPIGTLFSTSPQGGTIFQTTATATIGAESKGILRLTPVPGIRANLINLVPENNLFGLYTLGAIPSFNTSASATSIRNTLTTFFGAGTIASVNKSGSTITITFDKGLFLPRFTADGYNVTYTNASLPVGVAVAVEAQEFGSINISAGQVQTIVSSVAGMERVVNFQDFTPGRLAETDAELRARWKQRVSASITSSANSIKNRIEELDGVLQAEIFEGNGNIECVVNGGDETEIAQVIFDNKPAGVGLIGTTQATVTDERDVPKQVVFSRPDIFPVQVKVITKINNDYPIDGDEIIRQLLVNFQNIQPIGGVLRPSTEFVWALDTAEGLEELEIQISVDGGARFTTGNYALSNRAIPVFTNIFINKT